MQNTPFATNIRQDGDPINSEQNARYFPLNYQAPFPNTKHSDPHHLLSTPKILVSDLLAIPS
jgi:hypothetical protein